MKIYVAGKFEEAERVRMVHQRLRDNGFQITHDWTTEDASIYKGEALAEYKHWCATNDLKGVLDADAVLVLNHDKLFGGAAEMGIAIGRGIKVFVVEPEIQENIFFHLENARVEKCTNVEDAVLKLIRYANFRNSIRDLD